jgi:phosphoribosyl-ATP pyrophosphohydrolase
VQEAAEVALEAVRTRCETTLQESADLIYHLAVFWHECGIKPVWAEMRLWADEIGIAEKLLKQPVRSVVRP